MSVVTVLPPGRAETLSPTWTRWRCIRGVRPAWLLLCRRQARSPVSQPDTITIGDPVSLYKFAGRTFASREAAEHYFRSLEGRYRSLCKNPTSGKRERPPETGIKARIRAGLHKAVNWFLPR